MRTGATESEKFRERWKRGKARETASVAWGWGPKMVRTDTLTLLQRSRTVTDAVVKCIHHEVTFGWVDGQLWDISGLRSLAGILSPNLANFLQ